MALPYAAEPDPCGFAQEDLDELGEGRLPDPATSAPTPVPNATLAVTRALTAERPAWLYLFQGIVVTVLVAIGWVIYGTSQGSMAAISRWPHVFRGFGGCPSA